MIRKREKRRSSFLIPEQLYRPDREVIVDPVYQNEESGFVFSGEKVVPG